MKIGIVTTNYARLPILRIFCAGIKRLRQETGLDIPVVCVGSSDGADVCREYDIQHIIHPNKPLTDKFNRACLELQGKVDYVMVMGSDDLIATSSFMHIYKEAEKDIDLIGLSEVYFMCLDDIHTGKLIHFKYTTVLGVGRTVKASVLDKLSWQPWVIPKDRSIDVVMLDAVRDHVKTRSLLENEYVFDLKTNWNLNPVHFWAQKLGYMDNADLFWSKIGEEETRLIKEFILK